ncbi:MAG TPA: hypothetical protein VGB14_06125 [Acidimicrobiales bacterium]
MRTTIGDVARHPAWLPDWWLELPHRRVAFWRDVLYEPGQGWLRWQSDRRERVYYDPPDLDTWVVCPPAHRLWLYLRSWLAAPQLLVVGFRDDDGCRHRLSWDEVRPSWDDCWDSLIDGDRRRMWGAS